jgi:hypothetical protein
MILSNGIAAASLGIRIWLPGSILRTSGPTETISQIRGVRDLSTLDGIITPPIVEDSASSGRILIRIRLPNGLSFMYTVLL